MTGEDEDTCKAQADAILKFAKGPKYPSVKETKHETNQSKPLKKCVTQGIIKRDKILLSKGARESYTSTKIVRNKADWQADL